MTKRSLILFGNNDTYVIQWAQVSSPSSTRHPRIFGSVKQRLQAHCITMWPRFSWSSEIDRGAISSPHLADAVSHLFIRQEFQDKQHPTSADPQIEYETSSFSTCNIPFSSSRASVLSALVALQDGTDNPSLGGMQHQLRPESS